MTEASDQEVNQEVGEEKAVQLVFDHWQHATGRPKEILTTARRRIAIRNELGSDLMQGFARR